MQGKKRNVVNRKKSESLFEEELQAREEGSKEKLQQVVSSKEGIRE